MSDNSTATVKPPETSRSPIPPPQVANGQQEQHKPPQEQQEQGEAAPGTHSIPKRKPGTFVKGNDLWRKRESLNIKRSQLEVREAMLGVLTPKAMARAVKKMLHIIAGSDAKAAVAAFKVLTDAAGIRQSGDNARAAGAQFTFVLPGAGVIPEREQVNSDARSPELLEVRSGPEVEPEPAVD